MPFSRTLPSSDYEPTPQTRRRRHQPVLDPLPSSPLPPSSPQASSDSELELDEHSFEYNEELFGSDSIQAASQAYDGPPSLNLSSPSFPSTTLPFTTPARRASEEPRVSSPMFDSPMPDAIALSSRTKSRGGRPAHSPETRKLQDRHRALTRSRHRVALSPMKAELEEVSRKLQLKKAQKKAVAEQEKQKKKQEIAAVRAQRQAEAKRDADSLLTQRAQHVFSSITTSEDDGGFGFDSVDQFFQALWRRGGDQLVSSQITRYVSRAGEAHAAAMFGRSSDAEDQYFDKILQDRLRKEGRAIQVILTRDSTTSVMELLKEFSMDQLMEEIKAAAPTMWKALDIIATPDQSTRRTSDGDSRRNRGLVFTTICALVSVLRSQRANNFQLVVGLFLLGSGASKREISVLAHAGMSVSYQAIIDHVKTLSKEGLAKIREVIASCMCQIVWDNLNIAFRIAAQRLNSKNHFDSGTTATLLPVYDPETGTHATHGTLPLSMKPPRERTLPVLDWDCNDVLPSPEAATQLTASCRWQLKRIALDHIPGLSADFKKEALGDGPEVYQIPLHKTEQYPLPAMKIDEATLEGNMEVYTTILRELGLNDAALERHGLMFDDGDLLTDSLKEKLESARRNTTTPIAGLRASVRRWGLFHGQMAGCRMVVNEHWGQRSSIWAGGLWWEHNTLLGRKAFSAGWGGQKAAEWKPAHELLQISLAAHIIDGFRIYCGKDTIGEWAEDATVLDFNNVADSVFANLFSTSAITKLHAREQHDITLENSILYNRDALAYIDFSHAIKKGDIGRVLNVLRIWAIMMRTPKTMPRYADAMFETLVYTPYVIDMPLMLCTS
ncbi:hypothetical protein C8F01DRAFT_1248284 [Mycena amicta]|nr:hypothetical protein C8F01DRAFT_1248284 [Mycena amicta]